jgi:glycosyltransferase involved in cell wall biosynthesis
MDNIFLFTHMYPYGESETFLETEIIYLAEKFNSVTIIPACINNQVRSLPSNVKVEINPSRKEMGSIQRFFSALKNTDYQLLFQEICSHPKHYLLSGKSFWRALIYIDEAVRVFQWLRLLDKQGKIQIKNTLFYTYWLRGQALGVALFVKDIAEAKFISRAHGGDIYEERHHPPYLPFRREILQSITCVFTVSEDGSRYLQEKYPYTEGKVVAARLGVNAPGSLTKPSEDGTYRIVSCSSIIPVKRLDLLISGLRLYALENPTRQIEWHHIGSGPLLVEIREYADRILPDNVKWSLLGQISNKAVMEYYNKYPVDAFVNVSSSEGVPVSIMEAQSCGIPVIAAAVGGIPEIVTDENGVLLGLNPEPVEIADAFAELEKGAVSKRRASKNYWSDRYDAKMTYKIFIDQIENLMASKS